METNDLIDILAADAAPIQPLPSPWRRAAGWFAISIVYVLIVIVAMSNGAGRLAGIRVSRFWFEQMAASMTGIAAAGAACLSVIPGRSRRWLLLPAVPLASWIGILALGCIRDWMQLGAAGLMPYQDWPCAIAMPLGASVPVAVLLFGVRRGAPLTPAATAALAGLAGGALSSVVACVSRLAPHPTTMTVITWHFGALLAVVAIVTWAGRSALTWSVNPRVAAAIGSTMKSRRRQ